MRGMQWIAALSLTAASLGTAPAAAQGASSNETNWAICAFDVTEGTHVALLLFEPFRIAADKESFDSIRELFQEEAGLGSVLPGYEPHTTWNPGFRAINDCFVFPNENLARGKFTDLLGKKGKGYRFVETTDWRPSDEVTGLAKGPRKMEVAVDDAQTGSNSNPAEQTRLTREQREAEWQAKLDAYAAEKAAWEATIAEQKRAEERKRAEHAAAQAEADKVQAAYEAKMAAHRRELDQANRRQQEYFAAQRRHALCVGGDRKWCEPDTSTEAKLADASEASTDTDATTCVSRPVIARNATFEGNTAAAVVNGCETAVDVRICLMREGGWNCGVTLGLQPQDRWSHSSFKSSGEVFWDARVAGSNKALASPE